MIKEGIPVENHNRLLEEASYDVVKGGSAFVESKLMKTLAFFLEDSFSVF